MNKEKDEWVIRKGSYFYRPNAYGYTKDIRDAGVWPFEEAKLHINDDPLEKVTIARRSDFSTPAEPAPADEPESLRDKFAMAALTGLLAHASGEDPNKSPAMAYVIADAMMEARKKP